MASTLDETISAGQSGHISDHQILHDLYNQLASTGTLGKGDMPYLNTTAGAYTRLALSTSTGHFLSHDSTKPVWRAASDATAIHDDTTGEINALTAKASPTTSDLVIIEDAAASFGKKKAELGALPGSGAVEVGIAATDETTAIAAGTAKTTFRMPYAMTLTEVRASLTTACATGTFTVDINESGTSVLSTKLTIDATEKTSETAATPAVISDAALADDAEITVDVDDDGDGAATGLKVWLIGTRA